MRKIITGILYIISIILIIGYFICSYYYSFSPFSRILIYLLVIILMYLASFIIKSSKLMKINIIIWFTLYLLLLLTLTLFDSYFFRQNYFITDWTKEMYEIYFSKYFNIIPFRMLKIYIIGLNNHTISLSMFLYNILGNILAMMPLSFFLPSLFKRQNKTWVFILTIAIIVLSIEITQLLTYSGTCDIDDFIFNVSGAIIFFKIIHIDKIKKIINRIFINKLLV